MLITNNDGRRVDVTTARTLGTVELCVSGEAADVSLRVTVAEARALRDLLIAMNLGAA